MPHSPARLVVHPASIADAGRRLAASSDALESVAAHYRGPQQPPPMGQPGCTAAYATAHQQLAGLVTTAVARSNALARALPGATAIYAALDRGPWSAA